MKRTVIGIYGASGFGKEVLPLVRETAKNQFDEVEILFIDDNCELKELSNCKVINFDEFKNTDSDEKYCVIAIADSPIREKIYSKITSHGIKCLPICASNNVVMDDVDIGEGVLLCPFVTLTSNIKIGKQFHANIYSYVAHDCVIGDYVTFAPRVMCNGNVTVEDYAYIGTGAILKQGSPDKPLKIGRGAIVGMGAVVTKDVPPNTVVVGNPARPLNK